MGTETIFYPPIPNTSMISDNEEQSNLTPIIRNPEQNTSHVPQRRNHRIQLCQHLLAVLDTPESPPSKDQGQKDIFCPYDLPKPSTSASNNNLPNISTVTDGLQKLTLWCVTKFEYHELHHLERNGGVTGCLVGGKTHGHLIEEIVADHFKQTVQPCETVRERQVKRNAFINDIQSRVFTFSAGASRAKTRGCRDSRCP